MLTMRNVLSEKLMKARFKIHPVKSNAMTNAEPEPLFLERRRIDYVTSSSISVSSSKRTTTRREKQLEEFKPVGPPTADISIVIFTRKKNGFEVEVKMP